MRAQSGFAVASGITSLVVAAGLFTGTSDRTHAARFLAAGALAVWLLTMFLFLAATGTAPRRWQLLPYVSAAVATIVSVTAFVLITATSLAVDTDKGTMQVSGKGKTALTELCDVAPISDLVPGEVEVPTLEKNFVVFTIDKGSCFAKKPVTVKLPRADVAAFLEDVEKH